MIRYKRRNLESRDDRIVDAVVMVITVIALVIVLYPLIFVLSASISEPMEVVAGNVRLWPVGFTLEGYRRILEYSLIWKNSLKSLHPSMNAASDRS